MAITGPNGSGKSNIGDAIMFVLGPKSPKAVRAGRITDLIFSGGASKAKAKFMKVSLVFENSDRVLPWDDDTVILTRYVKLSDNGEDYTSYFYINDQKSTLGEFDSLLTKARISADGYNIVQQGDVTRIVQMGNIERRRILDGISGIASFDADIAKAQSEKNEVRENLERIEILRGEKEKQLKVLEKDKEQARIYLDTKEQLDIAKAQLTVRQRDKETATLKNLNDYVEKLNGDLEALKEKKSKVIEDQRLNEDALRKKEAEIEEKAGPEYKKIKTDVENTKISLATAKDRKETAENEIGSQNEFKQGFVESISENRNQHKSLSEDLNTLLIQLDAANRDYSAAKEEEVKVSEETSKHGGELTELQKKLELLEKQVDEAAAKDQAAKAGAAGAAAAKEHADLAKAEAEEAITVARFEVKDAEANLREVQAEVGPLSTEDISRKILDLKKEEAQIEDQESQLKAIVEKRTAEFNRLAAEKRVSDSVNGAGEAVSRILALKESGQMAGIHGTVAQLARVEPGYETALGVAAGNKMQAVVVDNDEVAKKGIEYLKKNGLSRVTFLPLSKMMPGKPRAKAIMVLKKTDGYATDFLEYAPQYTNVFWYVFQDTLVVKTIDQARELMGGIRMVTHEGELFEAAGAMIGGKINTRNIPKFGPSAQGALDEAAEGVRSANEALASARSKLTDLRERIRAADNEMRQISSQDIDSKKKLAVAGAALDQAKKNLKGAEENLAKKNRESEEAEKNAARKTADAEATGTALESLRNDRTETRERISVIAPAGLQQRIQEIRDRVYNCNQAVAELNGQVGGAKAELAGLDKQKEAYDLQIAEIEKKVTSLYESIKGYEENIEKLGISLEALRKIETEMESGILGLKEEKDALVQRRYELNGAVQKIQSDIEIKTGVIDSQRALIIQTTHSLEQLEEAVAAIRVDVPEPIPAESTLTASIRGFEKKLEEIGNINLRAIEEYDERRKELELLLEQVGIINKRITELDKLTSDLTSKKKGLFMEAYDSVNNNFKAIYRELSGGGEGFMALDDPDDPFSGGLQINAKPRNGKLLRLEALSGGEKSLTALSFIFAIQEYQPSPFYVLDEVDMFLDAVNSEMVARRVKESSVKAQFIQVSLRKVTLTLADHLIGVTRPPTGISRVIMQPDLDEVSKYEEEALKNRKSEE